MNRSPADASGYTGAHLRLLMYPDAIASASTSRA